MERDIKVGLVLGILLVALVAVLFFRRAPQPEKKLAALEEVDPQPDELPVVRTRTQPYRIPPEYVKSVLGERLGIDVSKPAGKSQTRRPVPAPAALPSDDGRPGSSSPATEGGTLSADLHPPATLANVSSPPHAPPPPDIPPRPMPGHRYVVRRGDTLASLAREAYGDESKFHVIFEANRDRLVSANDLPVGLEIEIPRLSSQPKRPSLTKTTADAQRGPERSASPEAGRKRVHIVRPGETLRSIARKVYGRESMYRAILRANRDKIGSPGDIRPGMELLLP